MDCDKQNQEVNEADNDGNRKAPEGWTKDDKYELLQALKLYGSQNCKQMQTFLPNKSVEEIKEMVDYYKSKVLQHSMLAERKKNKKLINNMSKVPLAEWAKLLTESLNFDELQTEVATALRLIAELEEIPPPLATNDIDFRKVYHAIANAMEGKTLPNEPAININTLLEKCIVETAYTSKSFVRNSMLRHIIDSIDLSDKVINIFSRPTDNNELATLRQLTAQLNYNPLKISEEDLKPTQPSNPVNIQFT